MVQVGINMGGINGLAKRARGTGEAILRLYHRHRSVPLTSVRLGRVVWALSTVPDGRMAEFER
jgi:hypothetical protein